MNGFVICGKPGFNGEWMKLGELCDICSGGTPKRSVPEYWSKGSIPWVKIGDISSKYVSSTEEWITEEGLKGSSAKMLAPGALLYSIFASIGAVGILEIPAATNQAIAGLTIKTDRIKRDYLYYFLKSQETFAKSSGRGAAQNNINLTILRGMEVPLPSIDDQRAIVEQLDAVEIQIERTIVQRDQLDSLVKSRFNELFGGCSAKVGADWPSVPISEVVQKPKSGEWGEEDLVGDGIKVLRTTNFTDTGVVDYAKVVTRQIDRKKLTNKGLKHGDILIEKSGGSDKKPVGRVVLFEGEDNVYLNNNFTAALRIKDATEVDYRYLFHFMYMNYWQGGTRSFESKTTGLHNLKLGDYLAKTKIAVPPIGDQRDFSAFVCQVDKLRFMLLGNPSPTYRSCSFCCSTNSGNGRVILEVNDY